MRKRRRIVVDMTGLDGFVRKIVELSGGQELERRRRCAVGGSTILGPL